MMPYFLLIFIPSFTIKGMVVDINKTPLPYASVVVKNRGIGTATDESGKFVLLLPDSIKSGELKVSYIGYKEKTVKFTNRTRFIKIVMIPHTITESPVVVKGSYSVSQTEGINVSKFRFNMLDVYTTPGAAADVFLTIKTTPAFSGDPDVATLTIRGGDPDETLVLINGIRMKHPYVYSVSEHGGLFSVIPTSAISQVEAFASVLPPAFGGKASGGIILKTLDVTEFFSRNLTLITGGVSLDLIHGKMGGLWTHLSSYKIMAEFNGIDTRYSIYPYYGSIFYTTRFSTGDLILTPFALYSYNKSELDLQDLGYNSLYSVDKNSLGGLSMTLMKPPFLFSISVGGNALTSEINLKGEFSKTTSDRIAGMRFQGTFFYDINKIFSFGTDIYRNETRVKGEYFESEKSNEFETKEVISENDLFTQFQYSGDILKLIAGVWTGYYKIRVLDPRILCELKLIPVSVKLGIGKMSQIKNIEGKVKWIRTDHLSLELERSFRSFNLRGSGFLKKYGSGAVCYGFEGLLKGKNFQIGAGWLRAKGRNGVPLDYEIPVKVTSFVSIPLKGWSLGFKVNFASGKPYTPVEGVENDSSGIFPIYGEHNSRRLPDIIRIDFRLSRMVNIGALNGFFFVEIYNITNHRNVSGYVYSKDYSERREIRYFDRMFIAGISVKM